MRHSGPEPERVARPARAATVAAGEAAVTRDPFAALGLAASPDLTDDDVRAAWRRVAAATHPDRADGGDPAAFAVAASAYSDLRTRFGRNEALADLRTTARRPRLGRPLGGMGPAWLWPGAAGRRVPGAGRAGRVESGAAASRCWLGRPSRARRRPGAAGPAESGAAASLVLDWAAGRRRPWC